MITLLYAIRGVKEIMFDLMNPWKTQIAVGNIAQQFNLDSLLEEISQNFNFENLKSDLDDFNIFNQIQLPILKKFKEEIVQESFIKYFKDVWGHDLNTEEYLIKGWLSYPKSGYKMKNHNHSNAHLSSSYYLSIDSENLGGDIHFYDPRVNFNRGFGQFEFHKDFLPVSFKPNDGDFFVFPSSLHHSVDKYAGQMRLALICDLFVSD